MLTQHQDGRLTDRRMKMSSQKGTDETMLFTFSVALSDSGRNHSVSSRIQPHPSVCRPNRHYYSIAAFRCRTFSWHVFITGMLDEWELKSFRALERSNKKLHLFDHSTFFIFFFSCRCCIEVLQTHCTVYLPVLISTVAAGVSGKTELAKQVARYMHKDVKKVGKLLSLSHTHTLTY